MASVATAPSADDGEFKVGFAISVYQCSGDDNSNWGAFERRRGLFGRSPIDNGDLCGEACTFFQSEWRQDIDRAHSLGSNAFRLSLEWSRIEPEQGRIDGEAVQRYRDIIDYLHSKGMEPNVTLHHFVHPLWFERLGGFENEGGIDLFVDYARTAFGCGRR